VQQEANNMNDRSKDITIAVDGSWRKEGNRSVNGIVTENASCSVKIIDIDCISKYCTHCQKGSRDNGNRP
jgi:hypothetical protein